MENNEDIDTKLYLRSHILACKKITIQLFNLFSLTFFFANHAIADRVNFNPSVSIKESYSDNILLAPKGQEQSESVTEISPAFTLQVKGNHLRANVNYVMQHLFYREENSRNEIYNQLLANSNSELIDDYFYFDANAKHSQQAVSAEEPIGTNNIASTGNRTNVTSYTLAPYFQHSYRNLLDATVRYSYSEVDYRLDELIDTAQTGLNIDISNPGSANGYTWRLNYLKQKNDFERGSDSEFQRELLQLGYRFTPRTHIFGIKGRENNSFVVSNNQNISDSFWKVGLDWQPSALDFFSFQYGERFFGHSTQFNWRHSAKRLLLNANYEKELSTSSLSLLESQDFPDLEARQNQPLEANNTINSDVFVKELATVRMTYTVSKTIMSFRYTHDRREFQATGDITKAEIANLSVSLRSTPVLTYIFGTTWHSNYTASTDVKLFNTNIDFAIQRRLAARLQGEFSLSHGLRRSTNATTDFDENIISLGITKSFN